MHFGYHSNVVSIAMRAKCRVRLKKTREAVNGMSCIVLGRSNSERKDRRKVRDSAGWLGAVVDRNGWGSPTPML